MFKIQCPEASRLSWETHVLQYHDQFSSSYDFPPPLYYFIYPSVCSLPCRIARGAGGDPGQPVSTNSSEVMSQQRHGVSLCSAAAPLTSNPSRRQVLALTLKSVHSSCSFLFWWKGGCVLQWTWKCGAALQKLITQGTRGFVWSEDYVKLNLKTRLAIL